MGRTMLIVGLLMTTLFAGIIIALQRRMYDLPDIMVRNLLTKEVENVSDYALRTAIRNAPSLGLQVPELGILEYTQHFNGFTVGNCTVDSIHYSFVESADHYRAYAYTRAAMQGVEINYTAEVAFNYPLSGLSGEPNCFYFEMDQPQFHGANEWIRDSSPNTYTGEPMGSISTRPNGSGANGWKCASFDGVDDYIRLYTDDAATDYPETVLDEDLTIVCFAKVRTTTSSNQGTLVWLASNPYDTGTASGGNPGQNLRVKPTGAIWYNYSSGKMHFTVTIAGSPPYTVEATANYTPVGKWPHNKDPWHFFALTYNARWGLLKGFINGVRVTTAFAGFWAYPIPNNYGISVGRRDIRTSGASSSDYKYFFGLMDQVGLYDRALSEAEIYSFYMSIIKPESIHYIKD